MARIVTPLSDTKINKAKAENNPYFNYIPSVKKYEVELINGHRFTLELDDQIEQLTEADRLGLEGYSSFEYDSHHENKLPKQTDYRRKANNPTWQPDTPQTTDEKDV